MPTEMRFYAHSLFMGSAFSFRGAPTDNTRSTAECLRVSTAVIFPLLLPRSACLSLSKSCHHFPGDAVLMLGNCWCVTWRSLSPFTDRATPAPWIWQEGGGRFFLAPFLHIKHLNLAPNVSCRNIKEYKNNGWKIKQLKEGRRIKGLYLGKSSSCHSSFTSMFSMRRVASVVPIPPRGEHGPADGRRWDSRQ